MHADKLRKSLMYKRKVNVSDLMAFVVLPVEHMCWFGTAVSEGPKAFHAQVQVSLASAVNREPRYTGRMDENPYKSPETWSHQPFRLAWGRFRLLLYLMAALTVSGGLLWLVAKRLRNR